MCVCLPECVCVCVRVVISVCKATIFAISVHNKEHYEMCCSYISRIDVFFTTKVTCKNKVDPYTVVYYGILFQLYDRLL